MDAVGTNEIGAGGQAALAMMRAKLVDLWQETLTNSRFLSHVTEGKIDHALYALYLHETYHYTRHNARNQALVGVVSAWDDPNYQQFCFRHAAEETGHEHMALHDIRSLDRDVDVEIAPPLPETSVLIAYLYWISSQGNPYQRLGYSYWAESCYEFIMPAALRIKSDLHLTDVQMTFILAHSEIDVDHARKVGEMLVSRCRKKEDWRAAEEVMETSLRLTAAMMDAVLQEYDKLRAGRSKRAVFVTRYRC